ncbi:hypothetical protein SASPL_118107 [Salvia splendens]|uniref:SKP1 component POZ domain-containing protein n=1 Tax=Salvia splendens TaxID=180675 RepID=A0A8X8XW55_SALSN|nr:hypothetical protein SASPL_118107 [Salvia splendens]
MQLMPSTLATGLTVAEVIPRHRRIGSPPGVCGYDEKLHTHQSLVFSNEFRYDSEDGNSGELRWGNIHVVAVKSQMIRHIIEDGCAGTSIPLPNVTAKILSKVIEAFHAEFVKENQGIL